MKEILAVNPPVVIQVYRVEVMVPAAGADERKLIPALIVKMADMVTEHTPVIAIAFFGSILPKRAISKKLNRGSAGIRAIIIVISCQFSFTFFSRRVLRASASRVL